MSNLQRRVRHESIRNRTSREADKSALQFETRLVLPASAHGWKLTIPGTAKDTQQNRDTCVLCPEDCKSLDLREPLRGLQTASGQGAASIWMCS